ncbi:hypothetical protein ACJX0J_007008, partial [Zea mays]
MYNMHAIAKRGVQGDCDEYYEDELWLDEVDLQHDVLDKGTLQMNEEWKNLFTFNYFYIEAKTLDKKHLNLYLAVIFGGIDEDTLKKQHIDIFPVKIKMIERMNLHPV